MNGLDDQMEPQFVVPQNSASNMPYKMGLTEHRYSPHSSPTMRLTTTTPKAVPLEKTFSEVKTPTMKCTNCENMAKNFLYLESLIRSNYNTRSNCSVCYSSLKYLQYVNKNIMQIFGSFDSIVHAAKAFAAPNKRAFRPHKIGSRFRMRKQKVKLHAALPTVASAAKTKPTKKKSKTTKRAPKIMRLAGGGGPDDGANVLASRFSMHGNTRRLQAKIAKKKCSRHVMGHKGDVARKKQAQNVVITNQKPKKIKPKRNKLALVRVLGSRCYHHSHV